MQGMKGEVNILMRGKIWIAGFVLVLLAGIVLFPQADADAPQPNNAAETFEQAEAAVFYLRALRSDGAVRAVGTGVVIDPKGTAATAYHVVKGADRLEAVFEDGRVVTGLRLAGYDELTDAAIVTLPASQAGGKNGAGYASLPLRTTKLGFGERVFAIGYPLRNTVIITEGIVNNPKAEINGRDRVLTSAEIVSGMSGGPLVDEKGRLAGIISGSLRTMNNIHLVIDMDDVRGVLRKIK